MLLDKLHSQKNAILALGQQYGAMDIREQVLSEAVELWARTGKLMLTILLRR